MRRKPDLIVPIRDRRQRRRILTLRNLGGAAIVLVVLFLVVTIYSEMRKPALDQYGQYGRLYSHEMAKSDIAVPKPQLEVIPEGTVGDLTAADPMLVAPAAREQYLGVTAPPTPAAPVQAAAADEFVRAQPVLQSQSGKVAIVGDANGVAVVQSATVTEHKLSGGIFRQP
jgi:hypothetical protein